MKKNRKSAGIVYTVKCEITGKFYVGATTETIDDRKSDHNERVNRGESGKLQKAILTFGPEAFTWTQIDTANSVDELAQKEKEYIIQYDSKTNGYNADSGGGFKKTVYQFCPKSHKLINKYDCLESAANAVNVNKRNISSACLGSTKTSKGFVWSYSSTFPMWVKDERKKKVVQINQNNVIVNQFNSVSEASKSTGVSKSCIAKVCRGERKLAGGFRWRYF